MSSIEIKPLKAQKFLSIRSSVPTWKLPVFFKKSFEKMHKEIPDVTKENVHFARYHNVDWVGAEKKGFFAFLRMMFMKWDLEVCVSIDSKIEDKNDIVYKELDEIKESLQIVHKGAYHKVATTYEKILKEAREKNIKILDQSFEFYLNDPREVAQEDLETLVVVPVKK